LHCVRVLTSPATNAPSGPIRMSKPKGGPRAPPAPPKDPPSAPRTVAF
jgi:hypothetical protein